MGDFSFYKELAPFDDFDAVLGRDVYQRLPDDWIIAVTDVTSSTQAIADGAYKQVNMAGASAIAAVINALGGNRDFPFVFGGDGCALAFPAAVESDVARALVETRKMIKDDMQLDLRVGMVAVSKVRDAGHDVLVARYKVSPSASFAMFSGNGLAWCENQLKAGQIDLPPIEEIGRPDMSGLSCRWAPLKPRNGMVASILAMPTGDREAFAKVARTVIALSEQVPGEGSPVDTGRLRARFPLASGLLEARLMRGAGSTFLAWLKLVPIFLLGLVTLSTGMRFFNFDPSKYKNEIVANSDFKKFDDGLRMTIDCNEATLAAIEAILEKAAAAGSLHFGIHTQEEALMTCFVPAATSDDHIHFIDGASGGYAAAATKMKLAMAA